MISQLFETQDHTAKYRQHRPDYPQQVFEHIKNFCFTDTSIEQKLPLAVDVACGSGQATVELSKFCDRVIGIDISANQIANATRKENIEYRCQAAEDLSFLLSNSVDLITIATSLHWLDIETFMTEVKRVLKPNTGILAVWTYGIGALDNPKADAIYLEFNQITLFSYSNSKRWLVDDYYQSLLPLFPYKQSRIQHTIEQRISTTIEQFLGFVQTLSACQTYRQQHGEQAYEDLLANFREKLIHSFENNSRRNKSDDVNRISFTISNPIRLYLMRKQ